LMNPGVKILPNGMLFIRKGNFLGFSGIFLDVIQACIGDITCINHSLLILVHHFYLQDILYPN
jgi:hypothetical protein